MRALVCGDVFNRAGVLCRSRQLAIQREQREKEKARRKAEEAVLAMKKARRETWNMKEKVLQKLAKNEEDRRTTAEKAKEELEERIRLFILHPWLLPSLLPSFGWLDAHDSCSFGSQRSA